MDNNSNNNIEIDATNRTLGRVSSEVAKILMGKTNPNYVSYKVSNIKVKVINASKTKVTPKKIDETFHVTYSGYPGGQKMIKNNDMLKKHGWKKLYQLAINGMLPANKLRAKIMKNLTIID